MGDREDAFLLVVYDIPSDRRRRRLHQRLLDYGTPVQYSVFECRANERARARMVRTIRSTISPRRDHVRIYRICRGCLGDVWVSGGQDVLDGPDEAIVV